MLQIPEININSKSSSITPYPTKTFSMSNALSWSVEICLLYVFLTSLICTDAKNTLAPHHVLKNGQTLTSDNKRFEMGFFNVSSRRDTSNRDLKYLGIWYREIKPLTVVWVANRMKPLRGNGVKLLMNSCGHLLLRDDEGNMISVAGLNRPTARPLLVLLDSGNLVIKNGKNHSDKRYAWQSFDFPSDTLLPGMKIGWDIKARMDRLLTSWTTSEDPGYGDFAFRMESPSSPQLLLEKNGVTQSRWGPWNGKRFSGTNMKENPVFRTVYHSSLEGVYFMFEMLDDSILLRLVVNSIGAIQFLKWKSSSQSWVPMVTLNKDICDRYESCGPYGICNAEDPGCRCLKGFLANSPHDWGRLDCTDGCRRKNALNCSGDDGFVKFKGLKLPDNFSVRKGLNPKECGDYCLKECTCMAYTSIDIYGNGSECVVWLDKLVDIRDSTHDGDELYIRMARAELDSISHGKRKKQVSIISSLLLAAFLGAVFWCATSQFRSLTKKADKQDGLQRRESISVQDDENYIQLFDLSTISAATNNFSLTNKIGQGGFGPVYQGELQDGQKIAVKRLSENSNQGLQEFKNEVRLIAQLQHRNLVKLLGCCIEGEERMLVYEYMPNKSLDQFIFDPARKRLLPWATRISILKGIAKGLDYLHFGSRLRVVHRDLKASNMLLDDAMNPKISDFGLARNFEDEREEITRRVIGTHGYMSPEYVMDGHYSTRSDVFSFGVLALEIISGRRNWGFHHPDHEFNLLGHAWKLWNEGRELAMIDPAIEDSFVEAEASRYIQVGLLCVQNSSEERPTISQVVSMLENETVTLPEPQEPGFFTRRSATGFAVSLEWNQDSVNGLTVTTLTGRA
ncbi:G-type lectin S-receptor-like serine/threonine-protein kinase At4g27290 [Sesamum indicum]|uniref:Receptor-like serine/threonine-protein kinase n=1 Tax=Sesamum indicum TaxID=4182 RepID=A0A8M8V444_SESIN|nr:G-type lectin S-receptor-like serine/threonine-protein kinase At4g27290 [Sesamum indicum]